MDKSNYLTVKEFSTKYNMTYNNVSGFISRGNTASFAFKTDIKPRLVNESYFIKNREVLDITRREAIFNFNILSKEFSSVAFSKMISVVDSRLTVDSARFFCRSSLFDYKDNSILACSVSVRLDAFLRASSFILKACRFIGSFDEDEIFEYIAELHNTTIDDLFPKNTFTYRVCCPECEQSRLLAYKPLSDTLICRKCSSKNSLKKIHSSNIKLDDDKVKYYYFCPHCSSFRIKRARTRKSSLCVKCSRFHSNKKPDKFEFSFDEMKIIKIFKAKERYFAICPICSAKREVKSKTNAGDVRCRLHANLGRPVKKKSAKPKKKEIVMQKKELQACFEEVKKEIPKSTPKEDDDMIAKFLKNGGKVTKL